MGQKSLPNIFQEPQPVDPWTGTQDAIAMAPSCPQSNVTFMSEDCLTLNVYVPQTESENTGPKSVMVFFHGGAFQSGSGSPYIYGPDEFCDNDVISVFPNYRVGPFGKYIISVPFVAKKHFYYFPISFVTIGIGNSVVSRMFR